MTIIQANKFYFLRGGAEQYVLELSRWLASEGHTVIPFAMRHPENLSTPYARYFPSFVNTERVRPGFSALKTLGRMTYSIEARRRMATLIAETSPDLCHIHNIYTQLSPSILHALHDKRVPVVMTVHDHHLVSPAYNPWAPGCGPDYSRVGIVRGTLVRFHKRSYAASFAQASAYAFHRALRIYERLVSLFLVPSEYMREQLIAGGFPKEKIRVNPYGVDPDTVAPRYDHDGYVLYVGRLSAEKGVETVVQLARTLPDLCFKIVGTGPEEAYLHALGHGCGNLEFIGFKMGDELKDLYRGAIAVLLPSRTQEVFPLITLEAMAAGKPVIASHVGGVGEAVHDRQTGLLVHPTDLHGWTEAVMRVAYDDGLRHFLSHNARLSAETTFHIHRHREAVLSSYAEAAG